MVLKQITSVVHSNPANKIVDEVKGLQNSYKTRDKKFLDWYSLLKLDDTLAQDNMESYVGNDPRTTWNMATYLLQPRPLVHQIVHPDGVPLSAQSQGAGNIITNYFRVLWENIDKQDRKRGKQSWFYTLIGYLTATGWYAIPNMMRSDGSVFVDYWNPVTVYPEWDDDGMIKLARVRKIGKLEAERVLSKRNVVAKNRFGNTVMHYQLWRKEPDGSITQFGVLDSTIVVENEVVEGAKEIPVLVGRTGGIPGVDGMEGQSILATNEPLYNNINRQQTFMQQLLRDTANPRWFERLVGNKSIIGDPTNLYKRGAIFSMNLQEEMGAIAMPPIPVELTQIIFQIRNQLQRGGFSDLTFGNVLQEISAVLISQAAEAALQLLAPYHNIMILAFTEISNNWYQNILSDPRLRPVDWPELPEELDTTQLESKYSIRIPGDLNNRINMAKTLNPRFELPAELLLKLLMPEVSNPSETLAQLDAEKAKERPEMQTMHLISAFDQASQEAANTGNNEQSVLFAVMADNLRKQVTQQPQTSDRIGNV